MLSKLYLTLFFLLLLATTSFAQPGVTSNKKVGAVNSAVIDLYSSYSFENGNYPSTEEILAHFTEDAVLSYISQDTLVSLSVAEFFEQWQHSNRENNVEYLQEVELKGRTEVFNSIAHRISSVKFTMRGKEESSGHAVISLQLVQINSKWLVHSMLWQSLSGNEVLPPRFREQN